jgi:hypothetical protein
MNKESKVGGLKHAMQCLESCMEQNKRLSNLESRSRARMATLKLQNAELLEALKQMVKEDKGIVSAKSPHSVFTIKKALDAIAKAEGRGHGNK